MAALPTQDEDLLDLFKLMDTNGNGTVFCRFVVAFLIESLIS